MAKMLDKLVCKWKAAPSKKSSYHCYSDGVVACKVTKTKYGWSYTRKLPNGKWTPVGGARTAAQAKAECARKRRVK